MDVVFFIFSKTQTNIDNTVTDRNKTADNKNSMILEDSVRPNHFSWPHNFYPVLRKKYQLPW